MNRLIHEVADKIMAAYETNHPIQFLRQQYTLDEATAYGIQDEVIKRRCLKKQDEIAGYKISMTSAETQAIANTHEPAYRTILASNILANNETISLSQLFSPLIEVELMFILQEDLTTMANETEIIEKTLLAPGIEIPDARYIDWFPNFSLTDLLSDNAATGLITFASPVKTSTVKNLTSISTELTLHQKKIDSGIASNVLGNPIKAVAWLNKKLKSQNKSLEKGMIVSSGTLTKPFKVQEGRYRANFFELGDVMITFSP